MLTITRDPDWRVAVLVFAVLGPILGVVVHCAFDGSLMSGLFALQLGVLLGPLFLIFVYVAVGLPALAAMAGFFFARRYTNLFWYIFFSAAGGLICEACIRTQAHGLDVAATAVTASLCALITLAISPQQSDKATYSETSADGEI